MPALEAAVCPDGVIDGELYYVAQDGSSILLAQNTTSTDVPIDGPLQFIYVLSQDGGTPENGALLVKRVYQIPDDWADDDGTIIARRRTEEEIPIQGTIYDEYHKNDSIRNATLKNSFHVEYEPGQRTDTNISRRFFFRFNPADISDNRKMAKPLILTWSGLSSDPYCLGFSINSGRGRYGAIMMWVYEIGDRGSANDSANLVNTVYVRMIRNYE